MAEIFAHESGVDALAVAVGTVHGLYHGEPRLDFDLLAVLGQRVPVPLVLHGGSGTGEGNLTRAVSLGICKINLYSEMISHYRRALAADLECPGFLHRQMRAAAETAISEVIDRYLGISGSTGKG
jgi:fructose/tagatose bisphosphate aldolase